VVSECRAPCLGGATLPQPTFIAASALVLKAREDGQIWGQSSFGNALNASNVVGIFRDRGSVVRLVSAVLAEQHDEWIEGRRYLGLDVLTPQPHHPRARHDPSGGDPATGNGGHQRLTRHHQIKR